MAIFSAYDIIDEVCSPRFTNYQAAACNLYTANNDMWVLYGVHMVPFYGSKVEFPSGTELYVSIGENVGPIWSCMWAGYGAHVVPMYNTNQMLAYGSHGPYAYAGHILGLYVFHIWVPCGADVVFCVTHVGSRGITMGLIWDPYVGSGEHFGCKCLS